MVDPITQMAAMTGWMRQQREKQAPRPGPTMEAWRARIPQDIEQPEHVQQRRPWYEMPSRDELVDMAANMVTPLAGTIENVGAKAAKKGIQAWHGSSSGLDLGAFSRKFFGKGQGESKHGMGLYTSEGRHVAEKYADKPTPTGKKGLYRVEIDADPEDFMDLDRKLGDQPRVFERVRQVAAQPVDITTLSRKKLQEILQRVDREGIWTDAASRREGLKPPTLEELRRAAVEMDVPNYLAHKVYPEDHGSYVLRRLEATYGPKGASKVLEDAGLAGTRYVDPQDQIDNIGKAAASNYAVFNPDRVKILEALGLAGIFGGGYKAMQLAAPKERRGIQPL